MFESDIFTEIAPPALPAKNPDPFPTRVVLDLIRPQV
jgi:hypothetical protein